MEFKSALGARPNTLSLPQSVMMNAKIDPCFYARCGGDDIDLKILNGFDVVTIRPLPGFTFSRRSLSFCGFAEFSE
jgi:hypothetical protein